MGWFSRFTFILTIDPRLRKLKRLLPEAEIYPCGSRFVCDPPVWLTDIDFLVYCDADLADRLVKARYKQSSQHEYMFNTSDEEEYPFKSWRKGKINLIVTPSKKLKERHNVATHLSKRFNVISKYHRIVLYETLRDAYVGQPLPDCFESDELKKILTNMNGAHGPAIIATYKARYNVEEALITGKVANACSGESR